jgi:PAS domain S-box-containing protein
VIRFSEQSFETLFDAVPALVFVTDDHEKIQWVNQAFLEFLKIPKEATIGKHCSDIFFSGTNEPVIDILEIVRSGEMQKGVLQTFFLQSGEEKVAKLDIIPYRNDVGVVTTIIGFGIDVTEQHQMEQIKRDVYEQLEKNIEQFAILGDHLRNPLTVIIGLCDMLKDEPLAKKIIVQAKEIDTIISRIDNGWIESEKIREFMKKYYDVGVRGTHELVARAIHENYIGQQKGLGMTPETNPSMRPWNELPPQLKDINLHQAQEIAKKLQMIGCGISISGNDTNPDFSFSDKEIELLAINEHERWMKEKLKKGWVYGAKRSDPDRIHDCLVPWDMLIESQKDKDRHTIIVLPGILSKVNLKIIRFS